MQCTNCGAELQPGATVCPSCEERVVLTKRSVAAPRKRTAASEKAPRSDSAASDAPSVAASFVAPAVERLRATPPSKFVKPVVAALIVILIVAGAWWAISAMSSGGNTPDAAALRMMNAYAAYDASGFLDNVTKASLTATDIASYESQAASLKAANQGKPQVKDVRVTKVTVDPANPDQATVQLSETILDPVKGTYAPRVDTLSMVKQNGKWLVRLY